MEPVISIVVPTYRGAGHLSEFVRRLEPVALGLDAEVILVDDASDDESWDVIERLAGGRAWLRGLHLAQNSGQQIATLAGIAAAFGEWIVTMDDDLEHDPDELPRVVACAREGYDLVYAVPASRRARPDGSRSRVRHACSLVFGAVFSVLIGKPPGVKLTSFRVLSRRLVTGMLADRVPAIYLSALALRQRPRVASILVTPGRVMPTRTPVVRLVRTFVRTIVSYGVVGSLRRRYPVCSFVPDALEFRAGIPR